MVQPFGENVMGKVVIRDSVGAGRGWDDYGVRFVELGGHGAASRAAISDIKGRASTVLLEEMLEKHLDASEEASFTRDDGDFAPGGGSIPPASQTYKTFLQRLLSASTFTPHETFLHPVACVIAISSRNSSPIETLRQLYINTSQGDKRLPAYANMEYLRYYVLVHDEDRDDITKSTALFDQMKRHFGLHCHLLRLRSDQCVRTDDDSVALPPSEWMTPLEDLASCGDQGGYIALG
jgi:trafficking protein particle complex subunit 8